MAGKRNMQGQYRKVIRDPIYGYIGVTEKQLELIELPVFQRLRRISQLSFADLVYPNANHNRFSHSLGVMHLSQIVSDYLKTSEMGKQMRLEDKDYEAIIWAGLLHDIGHLPFSHVCEPIFSFHIGNTDDYKDYHVNIGTKIIQDSNFGIKDILGPEISKKVCEIMNGGNSQTPRLLSEIMTGICSIDRLDYLKRDAYHAGTPEYGIIDTQRILTSLQFYTKDPYITQIFRKKALYALEGAILSHFNMYRAIYYHHAVRSAYLLFQDIIWEAFENYNLKGKLNRLLDSGFWNHFDDYLFLAILRELDDNLHARLGQLVFRKLPKLVNPLKIRRENIKRISLFIGKCSFKKRVDKEKEIKNILQEYSVKRIFLDSPIVIPYPRSFLDAKAVYIWEQDMEEPENIADLAPYLLTLSGAAEMQLAARVYVVPGGLRSDIKFIEALNKTIMETIHDYKKEG